MKFKSILAVVGFAALSSIAGAQSPPVQTSNRSDVPPPSLALSPAIIMVRGKSGDSTTQTLTITNHTAGEINFHLTTEDLVVRDGKRSFVPAGQTANGIAAGAVASPASVVVRA